MNDAAASWLGRLKAGLRKSSRALGGGLNDLFTKRKLDAATLEDLEDILITADLGAGAAARLSKSIAETRFGKEVEGEEIRRALAGEISAILEPVATPFQPDPALKPHVVLVCGVNGSGKTTTIGKLAHHFAGQGNKIMLAAGDTFRAAAVEQLKIWGERTGAEVISADTGADAAGLVFDALKQAKSQGTDILFIDTAGRLQNKTELMDELVKIVRVLKKLDVDAPHSCLLVLDATTGQNAHSQVEIFKEAVQVSGLIVTKLDGSSKGGVLVALA
ncbi:MAG: signal recognition particle-docking protein FtsY, partial [Rhodospirillales bacterium]|nr:signal recognition particle-docking protein FtsY [Rhodospirillales bacterium]